MTVEMQPIQSTNLEAHGYDSAADEFHVRFKNGATHAYRGVPEHLRQQFQTAESKGAFFHAHIRSKYSGRKVEAP